MWGIHWGSPGHMDGEGNSNPLQYSCLENPMDRRDWWSAFYGSTQSQTRLKQLSSSSRPHGEKWERMPKRPKYGDKYWIIFCEKNFCKAVQFSSVTQLCLTLCNPMNCSTPGLPVHHQLPESTQTHVHQISDAIQPSHPLSSPSPSLNLSRYQSLFQWVSSSHEVAKVLEFQLQHQSFQWTARTDLL